MVGPHRKSRSGAATNREVGEDKMERETLRNLSMSFQMLLCGIFLQRLDGVVVGSCGWGVLLGFLASTNDDYDDRTWIPRMKRIIRIFENSRIRYPHCRTREGSQSVKIRHIRLNPIR